MTCIECKSNDTHFEDGDDGHFRKVCDACGYVGGPYVSHIYLEDDSDGQTDLTEWSTS